MAKSSAALYLDKSALNSNFYTIVSRNVTQLMVTTLLSVLKTVKRQKQENMPKIAPVKEASSNVALGVSILLCIITNCNYFFLFFCWKEPNFTFLFISDTSDWTSFFKFFFKSRACLKQHPQCWVTVKKFKNSPGASFFFWSHEYILTSYCTSS